MPDLGDLLELLHDAGLSCRTVRAVGRTWHHADRARAAAAWAQRDAVDGAAAARARPSDVAGASERVTAWRVLFEQPGRARLERDRPGGDFGSPLVVVDDGVVRSVLRPGEQLAVVADRRRAALTGPPLPPPASPLLDPSALLGAFRFTVTGKGEAAGRPAIAATAVRTGRVPLHHTGLPPGVEELEILVDARFGVLLRLVCTSRGEAFEAQQVREIAFDEPVPPGSFDLAATTTTTAPRPPEPAPAATPTVPPEPDSEREPEPDSERAPEPVRVAEPERPPEPEPERAPVGAGAAGAGAATDAAGAAGPAGAAAEVPQAVSLEEAVRRAGFPLLLPRKVPGAPKLRILLSGSANRPAVQLHYQFEAPTHELRLEERPAATAEPATIPFERRTHRGHEVEVWEGPGATHAARIERAGISVRLDSDLDLEALLDLAVSLVPVRVTRSARGTGRPPASAGGG